VSGVSCAGVATPSAAAAAAAGVAAIRVALAPSSPTQVTVTCRKPSTGWPAFSINLKAVDTRGCTADVTSAAAFTVQPAPAVAISGAPTASVCAYAPSTTLTYTVTSSNAAALAVGVVATTTDVACSLRNNTGACTGTAMLRRSLACA